MASSYKLIELMDRLSRTSTYLAIAYMLLAVLGVILNIYYFHIINLSQPITPVISGEIVASVGIFVALILGYYHFKVITRRSIHEQPLRFVFSILLLTSIIIVYNALEESDIIPKNTFLGGLDDFMIPYLILVLIIVLRHYILVLGERVKVRSVFEKIYGIYGVLISLMPVTVFIADFIDNGLIIHGDFYYIIEDSTAALASIIIAYAYMATAWFYRLYYTYVDVVDVSLFMSGTLAFMEWSDLLENFTETNRIQAFYAFAKITGLMILGIVFLLVMTALIHMYDTIVTIEEVSKLEKGTISVEEPILVEFDVSNPTAGYIRVSEYIRTAIKRLLKPRDPQSIFFVYIVKPNSQVYRLMLRTPFKDSPRIVGLVLPEKMRIEEAGGRSSFGKVYYLPPIAVHINFLIKKGLELSEDRRVVVIIDNLTDLAILSDVKEVYLLLRTLQSAGYRATIFLLYPEGTLSSSDEKLIRATVTRRAEL